MPAMPLQIKGFRFINRAARNITLLAVLLGWTFFACTERERNNPFEPDTSNPPLSLTLHPQSNNVQLKWRFNVTIEGFTGFRVYRAVDLPANMAPLAELSAGQTEYTDTTVQKGRWYYYQVSVLGRSVESRPSNTRKTILGDGFCWVLSRSNANVQQLSYDLLYPLRDFQTFYLTDVWATPPGDSLFWLGTPTFVSSVVSLNRETGRETFYDIDSLRTARDLIFDPNRNQLYILDNAAKKLFVLRRGSLVGQKSLPPTPTHRKLQLDASAGRVWLLSETEISLIGADPPFFQQKVLNLPAGFTGKDMEFADGKAYVLATAENTQNSRLITVSGDLAVENTLQLNGNFFLIRYCRADQTFLLAEVVGNENERIVKLDLQGNRLFEVPGFRLISDIAINPFDRSFAVADFLDNLVSSYTSAGQRISESRNEDGNKFIFQPVRIFIE